MWSVEIIWNPEEKNGKLTFIFLFKPMLGVSSNQMKKCKIPSAGMKVIGTCIPLTKALSWIYIH